MAIFFFLVIRSYLGCHIEVYHIRERNCIQFEGLWEILWRPTQCLIPNIKLIELSYLPMVRDSSICSIELTKWKSYSLGAHKIWNRDNIIVMAVMYKQLLMVSSFLTAT